MNDATVSKITSSFSPKGHMGQKYLASGKTVSMRLWEAVEPGILKREVRREYETVGYVLSGRAELVIEDQVVILVAGDSWVVPKNAAHTYRILESFSAVEATSPPAQVHDRDEPPVRPA